MNNRITDPTELLTVRSRRQNEEDMKIAKINNDRRSSFKPLHPPRRVSRGPRYDVEAQVHTRIQFKKWPRNVPFVEMTESDDMSISLIKYLHKEASYSEYSSVRVYQVDSFEEKKSFSSSEMKAFKQKAFFDALRVRNLIEACPFERGPAINHLMLFNLLSREELIGIEQLITVEDSQVRRNHNSLVLNAQRELGKNSMLSVEKLAEVSIGSSYGEVRKAVARAALAARSHQEDTSCGGLRYSADIIGFKDFQKGKTSSCRAAHAA